MYKEDLALNNLQGLICNKTQLKPNHIYSIYMYKEDLALNNLQWLICHKTQPKPTPIYLIYMYKEDLALNNPQWLIYHKSQPNQIIYCNCLYFWDEVFSLIMLFGLTSSSRLFFSQRFGHLILRPSSGLSRTRELWNFEPNPLLFRGYHVLIPLIRIWYPRNNKGLGSKFQSSRVRDKPEEGRRIRRSNHIYLIYMYKEDLALNNLQWLICHKTQPNQILYN